jgi:uncharacterized repeat protein (TIGR03803 family)
VPAFRFPMAWLFLAALGLSPVSSRGQVFEQIYSFTNARAEALSAPNKGAAPAAGLLRTNDGSFYGTTSAGGRSDLGTVFRLSPTGTMTTLAEFIGDGSPAGKNPTASLIQAADGNFYGTTRGGGLVDFGTVFTISAVGEFDTLVTFTGPDGYLPTAALVQGPDGAFYGTTSAGGNTFESGVSDGLGTIFKVVPASTQPQTLVHFDGSNGRAPLASLTVGIDGNFYGCTFGGGAGDFGTIFKMTPQGALTTLVEFTGQGGARPGSNPQGTLLQASDGKFYGTASRGGPNNAGMLFRMAADGTFEALAAFGGPNGINPRAGLLLGPGGNFYGTTARGGAGDFGTVFRYGAAGVLTTLAELDGTQGRLPLGALALGGDGNFYGTAVAGGEKGQGTVFKVSPAGVLSTVVELAGNQALHEGSIPLAGLVGNVTGGFYGTSAVGGAKSLGTIFRMSPGGEVSTLVEFTGRGTERPGSFPISELLKAADGNFYGTTQGTFDVGNPDDHGTVFKMTPEGVLTTLVEFAGEDGDNPSAALVQDAHGEFYGTTRLGGTGYDPSAGDFRFGTIFKMTADGALTTLIEFSGTTGPFKGSEPAAPLLQASDGNFYGTTMEGGAGNFGTVFQLTPEGGLTTLVEFTGTTGNRLGNEPRGALVEGSDGRLYGVTRSGGGGLVGTIFRMGKDGSFQTLGVFGQGTPGSAPEAGLLLAADGNFYGTTSFGGQESIGSIFKMTPAGQVTQIFDFSAGLFDIRPKGPLIAGADGNLYGTSAGDLREGKQGAVFRLIFPGLPNVYPRAGKRLSGTSVLLQVDVNARGASVAVSVEYGTDGVNFPESGPLSSSVTGFRTTLLGTTLTQLERGKTFFYRYRAVSSAGTTLSPVATFSTTPEPVLAVSPATALQPTSAQLNGTVDPVGLGTTIVFEYGTDGITFPASVPAAPERVTGTGTMAVSAAVAGLPRGVTHFFRIKGTNVGGTTISPLGSFTTLIEPLATIGGASAVTSLTAKVNGVVTARGASTEVLFEYGRLGGPVLGSVPATNSPVGGDTATAVSALLPNLEQETTYFYRIRASSAGGVAVSADATFRPASLSGFFRSAPPLPPEAEGFLLVNLTPETIGGAWRFVGEQQWRTPGVPAGGLTSGDREVEFRTVPGYLQPLRETVSVISGAPATVVEREYFSSNTPGGAGLNITLKPDSLSAPNVPIAQRPQWRLLGSSDQSWRDSGATIGGLTPGVYLVEFKPVPGRSTPAPLSIAVADGQTRTAAATYFLAEPAVGLTPAVLAFETASTAQALPYSFVGQLRSDAGSATGFVVKPRVVATAAHVVFDEATLVPATGLQWLFQRDRASFEPVPQTPRGFYVSQGYASQRQAEGTPGESTPASQDLDAAALYFLADAGRGGFSGYLASDAVQNEWLISPALKTLVGYPIDGIPAANQGRVHATDPANLAFAFSFGHTYTTASVSSVGGASGGPLCVQFEGNNFYPAAIYLGGTGQTVVRAIDSMVVDLFNRAEVSANTGRDNVGGGITQVSAAASAARFASGGLRVTLGPAAAVLAGAKWRIGTAASLESGATRANLAPGSYTISFEAVNGFATPAPRSVAVLESQVIDASANYTPLVKPVLSGPSTARGALGAKDFAYQPTVAGEGVTISAALGGGETLARRGLALNTGTGRISGTPRKVGTFPVVLTATNVAGSSAPLAIALEIVPAGTLVVAATAGGTVSPATSLGQTKRVPGTRYTLTATPARGFLFAGWTGTGAAGIPTAQARLTFKMTAMVNLRANFVRNPFPLAAGTYQGLMRGSGEGLASFGMIDARLTATGAVTGSVTIGGSRYAFRSAFGAQGKLRTTVRAPGRAAVVLSLQLDAANKRLTGTATVSRNVLALQADRAVFTTKNPCPFAGRYTLALPHPEDPKLPQGDGFGTVTVTRTGGVAFAGTLGDGTALSQGAKLGKDGQWPFFALLFRSRGVLTGELDFQRPPATAISGKLNWLKPSTGTAFYPAAFFTTLEAKGSALGGKPLSRLKPSTLTISGGGLALAAAPFSVTFDSRGNATASSAPGFSLRVDAATGLYRGSFRGGGKVRPFSGVFLPATSEGFGFFAGDARQTGAVRFAPTP